MKSNQISEYKLELSNLYSNFNGSWNSRVSRSQRDIVSIQNDIIAFVENADNFSFTYQYDTDSTKADSSLIIAEEATYLFRWLKNDLDYFIDAPPRNYDYFLSQNLPDEPEIGEKYGIFNKLSGWLLRTESLSLALIVGLFGFGLLGSIGSTFIRSRIIDNRKEGNENSLVLSGLPGVMLNGISAAIIVFLVVKGAVIGDNLNPYVLFFVCLVASVFSEDVWRWAREKALGMSGVITGGEQSNVQHESSGQDSDTGEDDKVEEPENSEKTEEDPEPKDKKSTHGDEKSSSTEQ